MTENYQEFLEAKIKTAAVLGLPCELAEVPTHLVDGRPLKPHQRAIIHWAVNGGRRAIFAAFGLGKSIMQLETGRIILSKAGGRGLIVGPLGVRHDMRTDAASLGVELPFVRSMSEVRDTGLHLTNFDTVRDGKLDLSKFTFSSLDEAAVLRDYGSETFQTFLPMFEPVPYRFVATAMPSPNRYKELIHYGGFLGVMDTGQALTRFFQRNPEKAGDLTLYPHKEDEFWLWMHSWAVFLQKPSDLGYSDEGYDLPQLKVNYHKVAADLSAAGTESDGQMRLIRDAALSAIDAAREKRSTIAVRVAKLKEIVEAEPDEHRILWHDLEDERRAIEAAVPSAVSVYGSQDLDDREQIIMDFAEGRVQLVAAKPMMLGAGVNFQRHCARAVFVGITHKFHDFLQAVHRIWRFLQTREVQIDVIYAETEQEVLRVLLEKWERHNVMMAKMAGIIRRYGLNHDAAAAQLARSIGVRRQEATGSGWRVVNNDCVIEAKAMPDASVHQVVTSIPFSNHYEYTPSYNDFGHTDDDRHFFGQMDFLTPQLFRILQPGRLACVHVKDRILFGAVTGEGVPTVNPFHAKCIDHYLRHGFQYLGMIHINTDVVRENNQTYRLGYSEMLKDSTKMGVGSPEYVLLLRKPQSDKSRGYADNPVTKDASEYSLARWQVDAHAFWRSSGNRLLTVEELATLKPEILCRAFTEQSMKQVYDYSAHVATGEALASKDKLPKTFMALAPGATAPDTWHDVNRMETLNTAQAMQGREKHVCPLQFDIVDRLIARYSMKGELVFDPFGGLFTVPLRAVQLGRRGAAVELNADYFRDGVRYLEESDRGRATPSLFDLLSEAPAA